jgi:hypothetical protein
MNTNIHIPIYENGELVNEQYEAQTSPLDVAKQSLGDFYNYVSLQATMAVYDTLHGTHYRDIRNRLAREKRNHDFEARIGLVAVNKKTARG